MPKVHLGGGRYTDMLFTGDDGSPQALNAQARNLAAPSVLNAGARYRRRHGAKLARAFTPSGLGANRLKLVCVGDSLTVGGGAGSGGDKCTGAKAKAYPAVLAKLFRNIGFVVSEDSVMGSNRLPSLSTAGVTLYDPKVTFANSGWTIGSGQALGGMPFINSTTTDALTLTPAVAGQNIDVYYSVVGGGGTFKVTDVTGDGDLGATQSTSGGSGFVKLSRTRTLSAKPIAVSRTTGGAVYINGIDQWANDTQISIYNCGAYGVFTASWVANAQPYEALRAQSVLAGHTIILMLGSNNVRDLLSSSLMRNNFETMVSTWQSYGIDVVMMTPPPNAQAANIWRPYIDAMVDISQAYNIPLILQHDRFVDRATSIDLYADDVHLNEAGYADIGFSIFDILRP